MYRTTDSIRPELSSILSRLHVLVLGPGLGREDYMQNFARLAFIIAREQVRICLSNLKPCQKKLYLLLLGYVRRARCGRSLDDRTRLVPRSRLPASHSHAERG